MASVLILIFFNSIFVCKGVRDNCKDKKRLKAREQRKVIWNEAWQKVDQNSRTKFVKPRDYARTRKLFSSNARASSIKKQDLLMAPLPKIVEESKSYVVGQSDDILEISSFIE